MSRPAAFLGSPDSICADVVTLLQARGLLSASDVDVARQRIGEEFVAILERNEDAGVDARGRAVIALSSMVLACHNELTRRLQLTQQAAIEFMGEVLIEPRRPHVKDWLLGRMGIDEARPRDAFLQATENFRRRGEDVFGATFTYVQERSTADHNYVQVTRCAFNDFFRRNGAPELTPLFCALDSLWAEHLNAGRFNVVFQRPSVLSGGADACRFYFTRKDGAP